MTDDRSTYRVSVPQDRRWQFVSMAEGLGCEVVLKPSRFDEEEVIADGGREVALRDIQPRDLELMLAWRNNPIIHQHFAQQDGPLTWASHTEWFESRPADRHDWIIQCGGRRVGVVAIAADGDVGIYIGEPEAWGQGIASAALQQAIGAVDRPLVAKIHQDNERSQRLFESVGFSKQSHDDALIRYACDRSEPESERAIADGGQVRPLNYKKRKLLRVLRRDESPPSTSALAGHIDSRARACRRQLMGLCDSGHIQRIDQPGLGGDRWRLQEGDDE